MRQRRGQAKYVYTPTNAAQEEGRVEVLNREGNYFEVLRAGRALINALQQAVLTQQPDTRANSSVHSSSSCFLASPSASPADLKKVKLLPKQHCGANLAANSTAAALADNIVAWAASDVVVMNGGTPSAWHARGCEASYNSKTLLSACNRLRNGIATWRNADPPRVIWISEKTRDEASVLMRQPQMQKNVTVRSCCY